MANYYITGVFKNSQDDITNVMLHEYAGNNEFYNGVKVTEAYVIKLIDNGHIVQVLKWDYTLAGWLAGDLVKVVNGARRYLRSHKNNTVTDNLDNIIDLAGIIQ